MFLFVDFKLFQILNSLSLGLLMWLNHLLQNKSSFRVLIDVFKSIYYLLDVIISFLRASFVLLKTYVFFNYIVTLTANYSFSDKAFHFIGSMIQQNFLKCFTDLYLLFLNLRLNYLAKYQKFVEVFRKVLSILVYSVLSLDFNNVRWLMFLQSLFHTGQSNSKL